MSDARQVIFEEISKIPGSKKMAGDSYMVCCPFHDDNSPSCGINLAVETDLPLGFFHCFGCNEKGPWNKLAEHVGLTKVKGWELEFGGKGQTRSQRKSKNLTYETHKQELRRSINTQESIDWPVHLSWRGYEGKLIRKLGGVFYFDPLTDVEMLFFPIYVNNRYKGGVRAYMEKQVNGLSYLTSKGNWVKDSGLLGYEYVKRIVRKYGYTSLVLVEGPRDMLRLLDNNIPALAVLGSQNITEKKILRILAISSNIETIYVMPDNDAAGTRMYKTVKACANKLVKVKRLRLPREKDSDGKLIKMDPDNAPIGLIKVVRQLIRNEKRAP